MTLVPSILLLAFTGMILLAAIRHASLTFHKIYIDQSGDSLPPTRLLWTLAWNYFSAVLTFAQVYRMLFILDPGTFNVPLQRLDGLYFSIVTISSTGFGDIVPTTAVHEARCLYGNRVRLFFDRHPFLKLCGTGFQKKSEHDGRQEFRSADLKRAIKSS
jgi:hypothetical protein